MNTRSQAIVDDIRTLHQDGVSVAEIASRFHLPESTVQHVIATGTPPESQPLWRPLPAMPTTKASRDSL